MGKGRGFLRFPRALAAAVKLALNTGKTVGAIEPGKTEFAMLWITPNKVY